MRESAHGQKPQIGICFGHQLMAQAFGGVVEKSPKGWGVGVHEYEIQAPRDWMRTHADQIACAVSHQDQVTQAPQSAHVFAGSDFAPMGRLNIPMRQRCHFSSTRNFRTSLVARCSMHGAAAFHTNWLRRA